MMYSGTHMFSQFSQADPEFEMGWFAIPSPDGKTRLVGSGVGGLAISAESAKDPDKKAAAEAKRASARFLQFCSRQYVGKLSFLRPLSADPVRRRV